MNQKIKPSLNNMQNNHLHNRYRIVFLAGFYFLQAVFFNNVNAQTELQPWGNITGIRIDGQLMSFESSLCVVAGKDWSKINATGKEKQRPKYIRDENAQVVTTRIDSLYFTERVEDVNANTAKISVEVTSKADANITGVYFCIELSGDDYNDGTAQLIEPSSLSLINDQQNQNTSFPANGIKFIAAHRQLELIFPQPTSVIIKKETGKEKNVIRIFIPLHSGNIKNDQTVNKTFTIKASGDVDKNPVTLTLNAAVTGRAFDGLGGNFRLQNPKTDPQVIDYSLKNLRVAWARVEMPWAFWQPVKESNPIDSAIAGKLNPRVLAAIQMAQRASKMHIPIILSAWFPPKWAIVGAPNFRPRPDGVWGNPLDHESMNEIYKSITDYILYLKKQYGVEIKLFSFNESDLGINIRLTGQEHAELIKGLGTYFESKGLKTKMLLGDNSDANTYDFINPAMADEATHKYIGAVSFHSWRGWEKETLQKWADAATKMNLPLIVGEGSIDAAASIYPAIFQEQTYAIEEINLYTRILSICQPASILQWQLTADYSPLAGGGIFGNNDSLHPTQRFWNLKQLASTPQNVFAMQITNDAKDITSAALGNNAKNIYSIQLVNNGASRMVTIKGFPKKIKKLKLFVTNKTKNMQEENPVAVINGEATFQLDQMTYATLVNK
jgi:hypothetical protein